MERKKRAKLTNFQTYAFIIPSKVLKRTIQGWIVQSVSKAYVNNISPTPITSCHLRRWLMMSWADEWRYITLVLTQLFSWVLDRRNKLHTRVITFFCWDGQIVILITRQELTTTFTYPQDCILETWKYKNNTFHLGHSFIAVTRTNATGVSVGNATLQMLWLVKKIIFLLTTEKHCPKIKKIIAKVKGL